VTPRLHHLRATAALVGLVLALAGCTSTSPDGEPADPAPTAVPTAAAPGLVEGLVTDGTAVPAPLVVLVPGGGWSSADPSGLRPLAADLAAGGASVALSTYRTSADRAWFPLPVQDVACATAQAAAEASEAGRPPTAVVLVGHSAGAQLAAVVALDPAGTTAPDCPYPPVRADGLVGLAGPYDVVLAADVAANLFGPQRPDPADWDAGNPMVLADRRPEVPVLLLHGRADGVVPIQLSEAFADALTAGGHAVTTRWLDGVDHQTVYSATVAAPQILTWLAAATPTPTPTLAPGAVPTPTGGP
jgi:acetyl esterase/lipase